MRGMSTTIASPGVPALANHSSAERVTAAHWLIVIIASAGWLFDCMDQRIFILARESALRDLLGPSAAADAVKTYGGYATTAMIWVGPRAAFSSA